MLKVIGYLLLILAASMLAPIGVAYYYDSPSLHSFIITCSMTIAIGFILIQTRTPSLRFMFRESILVVSSSWILFSLVGAIPFVMSTPLNFSEAVFESMSGFTTTGASVINDIEALDHAVLFWRSLTHWIGGMGIIVLSLAIMPLLGHAGSNIYKAEVTGPTSDKLLPKLQSTAKLLWIVYVSLTLFQAILLKMGGMNWFDAICHAFATLATGGFSTKNASVAAFDSSYIHWVITIFMFIAGTNFALHVQLFMGQLNSYKSNFEFRAYLRIFMYASIGMILFNIAFSEMDTFNIHHIARDAFFQAISILTTTGFVSADYSQWHAGAQLFIFLLMMIGGCGGSTGGGIKVIRLLIVLKTSLYELKKVLHPQAVMQTKIGGKSVKEEVQANILSFFILYCVTIFITATLLCFTGLDIGTSLSAAVSSVGNIGPGFAGVGPVDNFSAISDTGKWILSLAMLAGRLELFTILLLFTKSFWKD